MKYAVIKTGGKQYRVSEGDELDVEKLGTDKDKSIAFDNVLMVVEEGKVTIGEPEVKGAKVKAKVIKQFKGDKIRVARFRRRKRHHKVRGHRQHLTRVKITQIEHGKD